MSTQESIADNLQCVRSRIHEAALACGRDPASISLLAVSKMHPVAAIEAAFRAGQRHFGESYAQEAVEKVAELKALDGVIWHFIGPLQSNKTRPVAEHFDWVHSVDRLKIAQRLSDQRPAGLPPLNICLQVNIDHEGSKSGVAPEELAALAEAVNQLPQLCLRGLMCIPDPTRGDEALRQSFAAMQKLFETLRTHYPDLDTLSMGMSDDLDLAIAQGATIVRVGTAIFGQRNGTSAPL
ncbi:MAG: YggS family pyridoxal phosphate-dependent enzyme [Hahellaceae bacterium]|nr:YggS family pyridoxal phosphate-dependent enzyme [Hahellaceae bacterium]